MQNNTESSIKYDLNKRYHFHDFTIGEYKSNDKFSDGIEVY